MRQTYFLFLLFAVSAGTAVQAQDNPDEQKHPCTLTPIFHCAEPLDDGGAIAHFGYDLQCPKDLKNVPDLSIPIGKDNRFHPDPVDRGQTTLFTAGKHVDEFDAEFTAQERKDAKDPRWSVQKTSARVGFSKGRDEDLDCRHLPN